MNESNSATNRPCPACGSTSARLIGSRNGFDIVTCFSCGTVFTSRLPTEESEHNYDAYYHAANLAIPDFVHRRLQEIAESFASFRSSNRLLDVGFGSGALLQATAGAGWDVQGTEVSPPAIEHARSLGFNVFQGTLQEAAYPDNHFDVVTAVEVLEHVPDNTDLLREVARILRPGGLFWATTPHGRGLSARLLGTRWSVVSPPEHLQLFSAKGVRQLLRHSGFRHVEVATHGINPMEIVSVLRAGRRAGAGNASSGANKPGAMTPGNAAPATAPDKASGTSAQAICTGSQRVETSYKLNKFMTGSPSRRVLKNSLNGVLNVTRTGDALKIRAVL
jgi:2-polyprenyl-3-methyl-5-hydroxy-6-metoxy-1,4-benzoquinol methylase